MILITKTLSSYLTEDGKEWGKFKDWIANYNFAEPIGFQLTLLIIKVEDSKWLEKEQRQKIFQEIRELLLLYVKKLYEKEPSNYFQEYITELDKYCFQGGFGYSVAYNCNGLKRESPHHWMINPENYEKVQKLNEKYNLEIIKLCAMVCNCYLVIDDKPTWAKWSG